MAETRPLLVAATDDRRLARADFSLRLEALLEAGCPAVWLRTRAGTAREFLSLARAVRAACHRHGAELWIGDRADVAALVGADSVQLPERGLSIAGARCVVGPSVAIGRSVHSVEAAAAVAREGAERIVAGTIFASGSHPEREPAGTALIGRIRVATAATGRGAPRLYAIGGIESQRVEEVVRAGADGIAAIGALWDADDPAAAARAFLDALRRAVGCVVHSDP